jgi:hemoglobin-like flavoprotein
MTNEEIQLVKHSWKLFRDIDPKVVGDTFYSKLFSDTPSLRHMFPRNMEAQYQKLTDMLSTIVARLEKIDELSDDITALGKRHTGYGVRPGHYKLVGRALLWTLEQGLGMDWTPQLKEAWTNCYAVLSQKMIASAS